MTDICSIFVPVNMHFYFELKNAAKWWRLSRLKGCKTLDLVRSGQGTSPNILVPGVERVLEVVVPKTRFWAHLGL